jgi:hypothetical protein
MRVLSGPVQDRSAKVRCVDARVFQAGPVEIRSLELRRFEQRSPR